MKINETKTWDAMDIRSICIKNDWYTCGSNEEYTDMLDAVDSSEPTTQNIYKIAKDIYDHSDMDNGNSEIENIENIMFHISADVIRTFYEIEG